MIRAAGLRSVHLALAALLLCPLAAQGNRPQEDKPIDGRTRSEVLEGCIKQLNESYVFPEKAKEMEKALRRNMEAGVYDGIESSLEFSRKLTEDLQAVSKDKHLRILYRSRPRPARTQGPTPEQIERYQRRMRESNYGFEKVARLEGNVGYLDLRGFFSTEDGAETAAAAMNFLANSDALIIDLRKNGGGSPAMVALISSYLFDAAPVHLNSLYWRPRDFAQQWWTLPYVPGKRSPETPVYLLTSSRTFSAAEEFAYNLKTRERAMVIGETTGGGAHPGGTRPLTDHFAIWLPTGRAINPITKTNWEGTGVEPDISAPADQALSIAHAKAIEKLIESSEDEQRIANYRKLLKKIESESKQMEVAGKR